MCADGKCVERRQSKREAIVHLGRAARSLALVSGKPHMVIQALGHLMIGPVLPEIALLGNIPGSPLIIAADASTTDQEIERLADEVMAPRVPPDIVQMLELLLGVEDAAAARREPGLRMERVRATNHVPGVPGTVDSDF